MSLNLVTEFTAKKAGALDEENDSLDTLAKNSPNTVLQDGVNEEVSANTKEKYSKSPLSQLGTDFIAEQVSKNGSQILNNATGLLEEKLNRITGIPIRKTIEEAQNLAFNAISAAITAKNDLILFFLQQTAQAAIDAIVQKREIIEEAKKRQRYLYNALVILVAGNPFFSQYLTELRRALALVVSANNRFTTVRNTFIATDIFINAQFGLAISELELAEELITPEEQDPDVKFTNDGLLSNVGVPTDAQQLTLILSIPQLVQDLMLSMNGYFAVTLKVNALLFAFTTGLNSLQQVSSRKLSEYTVSMLDSLLSQITSLANRMASKINGDPQAFTTPVEGFNPDPVSTSAEALRWIFDIRAIIEYARFIPGKTLSDITLSNNTLSEYQRAVEEIKKKGDRIQGDAVLRAVEGREEVDDLETQVQLFALKSLEAMVSAEVAENILALGRTVLARLDLAQVQDTEIEVILKRFVDDRLPLFDSLKKTADGIFATLNNLGLDRASDMLKGGNFSDFFNLNTKTATYAGAALVGLAVLKECLHTVEDQQQLVQAEREIQRENKSKELLAQRGAVSGIEQQRARNESESRRIQTVEDRARQASEKCGVPDDLSPVNLVKKIGPVIGVSTLMNGGSTKFLNKIGKGIL